MFTDDSTDQDLNVPAMTEQDLRSATGYVRPYRDTYAHTTCGTETNVDANIADTLAREPKFYGRTFCADCDGHFPIGQFRWSQDGEVVGS